MGSAAGGVDVTRLAERQAGAGQSADHQRTAADQDFFVPFRPHSCGPHGEELLPRYGEFGF